MRGKTNLTILAAVCALLHSAAAQAFTGAVNEVPLRQQTQITVKIVPKLGTRLIFPFILDDPKLKPPLNYKLTNTADFEVARKLDSFAGQNVFLVTSRGGPGAVGKLYISIAGYNLALNLISSHRIGDHISDIYFNLTADDRNFLIDQALAKLKDSLERAYKNREDQAGAAKHSRALAAVVSRGLKRKNIKQLLRGGRDKFSKADIYLDKFLYRAPEVYVLNFWVEHYSTDKFGISSMLVQSRAADGSSILIDGKLHCFNQAPKLDECVFITDNSAIVAKNEQLTMTLTNDQDEVFVITY